MFPRRSILLLCTLAVLQLLAGPSAHADKIYHTLSGTLTRADGGPLKGIPIHFVPIKVDSEKARAVYQLSDRKGRWMHTIKQPGVWEVRAAVQTMIPFRKQIEITGAGNSTLDIQLQPVDPSIPLDELPPRAAGWAVVEGRVVHHRFNAPVRGAKLALSPNRASNAVLQYTDSEGYFKFPALEAGRYRLDAGHPSYFNQSMNVEVLRNDTTEVRVAMSPRSMPSDTKDTPVGALAGKVVDALLHKPLKSDVQLVAPTDTQPYRADGERNRPFSDTETYFIDPVYAGYVDLVILPSESEKLLSFEPVVVESVYVAPNDTTWRTLEVPLHFAADPARLDDDPGQIVCRLINPWTDKPYSDDELARVRVQLVGMPHIATSVGGRVLLDDVPPGTYSLQVVNERMFDNETETVHWVHVFSNDTTEVDIELREVGR